MTTGRVRFGAIGDEPGRLPVCRLDRQVSLAASGATLSERTIELMGRFVVPLYSQGRMAMLAQWFDWVESRELTTDDPSFVCGASVAWALAGDPRRSERWARGFQPGGGDRGGAVGPDEGYRSLVAAWQGDRGAKVMLADAARAVEMIPPTVHGASPPRPPWQSRS
jgi:hypothetical protein